MILSSKALRGATVVDSTPKYRRKDAENPDAKPKHKKIGTIDVAVFHPTEPRIVGFIVKRPDAMMMVKREDRFLAWDRFTVKDDKIFADDAKDSWDEAACKRLGIDYDACIVWEFMPIRTNDGASMGYVDDIRFSTKTGRIKRVHSTEGGLIKALLGEAGIPLSAVRGYRDGAIEVDLSARELEPEGGLAAKAGAASAKAKYKVETGSKKAEKKAHEVGKKAEQKAHTISEKTGRAADESIEEWAGLIAQTKSAYDKARHQGEGKQGGKKRSTSTHKKQTNHGNDNLGTDLARAFGRGLGKAGNALSSLRDEYKKGTK